MASHTEHIALFPLNVFLLPAEYTQLHIFEERYKQLIFECENQELPFFGIVFNNKLNSQNMGSIVELVEIVRRYPGGEMDVLVKSHFIFKLETFQLHREGKLYPGGEIYVRDDIANIPASMELSRAFKAHLLKFNVLDSNMLHHHLLGLYDVANELSLQDFEKLELMELSSDLERDAYLINYLRYLEMIDDQEKRVQDGIFLN